MPHRSTLYSDTDALARSIRPLTSGEERGSVGSAVVLVTPCRLLPCTGQQRLVDHVGNAEYPQSPNPKCSACPCCAGDPRSPQGQRAALIVSELRNFAFCAYATNWRNYIDVEMTTDGSLMPLPGGTESTRRLAAVCVRTQLAYLCSLVGSCTVGTSRAWGVAVQAETGPHLSG